VIERYSRPEMAELWTTEARFQLWLRIEILACEARSAAGLVPAEALKVIQEKAAFDVQQVEEIEREVKHDVIAFLTSVAEHVGPESRFTHQGLTSSDVLDTALAAQLTQAAELLTEGVKRARKAARALAERHRDTPTIGRSHGIHAEPTTFGLKAAGWYAELTRALERVERAREIIAFGKLSGAVGTFANIDPSVEAHVCQALDLKPEPVSTQVVPRDRHAEYFSQLAVVGATIERIAVEVRHLQRTEVREAEEAFTKGQKGSSAMPHKRNPILSENLTGLARLLRGYAMSAMENVALWHERDISHSSVERVIGPDATILLDFALHRLSGLLEGLVVYPERMLENMEASGGLYNSQGVLLALTNAGMTREDAYKVVQRHAMATWEEGGSFKDRLKADADVVERVGEEALEALFDPRRHLQNTHVILDRVLGDSN
jgi:adenylosuccinate lyase